jgi:hypothetical protein
MFLKEEKKGTNSAPYIFRELKTNKKQHTVIISNMCVCARARAPDVPLGSTPQAE